MIPNEISFYILELLERMDKGFVLTAQEQYDLVSVIKLDLSKTYITSLPDSIGSLTALQTLDLSNTQITSLPDNIGKLTELRKLYLWDTNITTLPESIGNLSALQELYLGNTGITRLPDSICNLTSLQDLQLDHTKIAELPDCIGNLTALEKLDLHRSSITVLPDSIGDLTALRNLNLKSSCITTIPDSIGKLTSLQSLDLRGTGIAELPDSIGNLTVLQELGLSMTKITKLPNSVGNITELEGIYLTNTNITSLPESIKKLSKLQVIYLFNTKITSLPEWIGFLPHIYRLDISGLTLDKIPESLAKRGLPFIDKKKFAYGEPGINLHNTILKEQNISCFLETPELIPSLYSDQVTLPECKIIFLGDGEAGKSYTIKRFINEGIKETEEEPYVTTETPGVEIVDYHVDEGEDSFDIHFWDFGGQQILHSMHRCFLTEQTCYVIVVKTRDTEADRHANYWLQNVTAFAPQSPIILLINCWENDDGRRSIDENRLRKVFPKISDVVYCSAKQASYEEFQCFMSNIINMAKHSNGYRQTVNRKWDKVRQQILDENKTENVLTKKRYYEICEENGIKDADALPLLTFFNNIGVCFSYHRDRDKKELAEYKLLKPVWLTNALYAIIEEGESYAQDGRIKRSAVEDMLGNDAPRIVRKKEYRRTMPDFKYDESECGFIIDVAAAYNLCYRIDDETLFFPALCTNNTPMEELEEQSSFPNHIEYQLEYAYLPDSVIHQLMIRCLRKDFAINKCWLRGMVLGGMDWYKAIIRMNDDYKTLKIDIFSRKDHSAHELFNLLREEILGVNSDLNLSVKEFIAKGEDRFAIRQLLNNYKKVIEIVICNNKINEYSLKDLIDIKYDDWTLA